MNNNFRDVHTFDGTLGQHFSPTKSFTKEEKKEVIFKFCDQLQQQLAKDMTRQIVIDLDTGNNIDKSNNIDSSDVLAEICKKVDESDIDMSFIEEQIIDIALLGPCPEGRTTRFLQIWQAIKDC